MVINNSHPHFNNGAWELLMTGSGKMPLGPHYRGTESQSGRGEFPEFAFFSSLFPVILMLIEYANHYNRVLLFKKKPCIRSLWGTFPPQPSLICKSLSSYTLSNSLLTFFLATVLGHNLYLSPFWGRAPSSGTQEILFPFRFLKPSCGF